MELSRVTVAEITRRVMQRNPSSLNGEDPAPGKKIYALVKKISPSSNAKPYIPVEKW